MPTKLRKVAKLLLKDQFGSGSAQIVAASVTGACKVYKQGATVTTTGPTTIATGTALAVRDTGGLVVGDTVQKGTDGAHTATVASIVSRTSITLTKVGASVLTYSVGDRIVVTTSRPTVYTENTGVVGLGSSDVNTDAAGLASFYTTEPFIDLIYSGTGLTTSAEYDVEAGYMEPQPWLDIRAYGNDLVRAIAALPALGGTIYMPSGTYTITGTVTINVTGVHLLGDLDGGTIIQPSATNPAYHMFQINKAGFRAEHIEFNGRAATSVAAAGAYDIMRWNGYGVNGNNVQSMYLSECYFHAAQRTCLRATDTFECVVEKCLFNDNPYMEVTDAAVIVQSSTGSTDPVNGGFAAQFAHIRFYECRFSGNNGFGLLASAVSGLHVDSCRFEVNYGGVAANRGVGLAMISSTQVSVHHCHFEGPYTLATARANQWVYFGACRAVSFINNSMVCIGGDTGNQLKPAQAALFETVNGATIGGNQSSGMNANGIVIASDCGNIVMDATEDYGNTTDKDRIDNIDTCYEGSRGTIVRSFTNNAARDAADGAYAKNGCIIYNLDSDGAGLDKLQCYVNGAWVNLH